ncbi:MAG: tRNA (adenosine(37)-N6)-threonylcarbamoyltransferase complex dimerization subunit type 1 TsaB [Alphaproteobacteria bacterium]|nr:tRNA (adenosine(37)-N6)-threonylcarbamoyltransferase complex dimerization subunit type 1 TsaB [Alphaproteobacteria bacterium]
MTAPTILGLDTAGPVIGAALLSDAAQLWSARVTRGADALLAPALAELLATVDRLDGVAVSVGPGAFTSLRVGVAAALGVAMARGCPVVPVSSLEARARGVEGERVLAMLDGRKGRAYVALRVGEHIGPEADLPPEQAVALADRPFVATGEGALVWRALVEQAGGVVAEGAGDSPALTVARLGRARLPQAVAPEAVRLNYIRSADARLPTR